MMETRKHRAGRPAGGRPTSGREVVLVLLVAALAVLGFAPGAAGTLVTIVDSIGDRAARVDRTGSLTVATRPANASSWRAIRRGAGALFAPPGTAGSRQTLVIGSLTVTNGTVEPVALRLDVIAPCGPGAGFVDPVAQLVVQPGATLHLAFPEPMEVSAPRFDWCLNVSGDPALPRAVTTTGVGFVRP